MYVRTYVRTVNEEQDCEVSDIDIQNFKVTEFSSLPSLLNL